MMGSTLFESRAPTKRLVLQKIIGILAAEMAAGKEKFVNDLKHDPHGVSYSCSSMLYTTKLCYESSLREN